MPDTHRPAGTDQVLHIRLFAPGDAEALHALDVAVHEAGDGVVLTAGEIRAMSPDEAARRMPGNREGCAFIAEFDGRLVAQASIRRRRQHRIRHVAGIDISVHPEWQGCGIGRRLLVGLLTWADHPDSAIDRVELSVRSDNQRAIALYESLGFELEGVRRGFLRLDDGSTIDDHSMSRLRTSTAS